MTLQFESAELTAKSTSAGNPGFQRQGFSSYRADLRRAHRHLSNALDLAEKNGIADAVMAAAFLDAATRLLVDRKGASHALYSLETAYNRIATGEFEQ